MTLQEWIAEGVNSEKVIYWGLAHVGKFLIEGLVVSGILAGLVIGVSWALTASTRPALPALLNVTTGVPYGNFTPVAGWLVIAAGILKWFMWCRLDEKVET